MPNVLEIYGWRLFFYANEGNEPIHIHARKGDSECKYWILIDEYDIEPAFEINLKSQERRKLRKIIFSHFEYICERWNEFQERK